MGHRQNVVLAATLVCALALLFTGTTVNAQTLNPRIGIGADMMLNPLNNRLSNKRIAMGFRVRASLPLNQDVSLLGGLGLNGFILGGSEDALYVANPETALIVTLRLDQWAPYIIGGFGGFIPMSGGRDAQGGPAIHGGIGWVRPLAESSVYVEINPYLILWDDATALILPLRVGVIL